MVTQFDMARQNEIRQQRAAEEFPSYRFRRTMIAGQPAVYVITPKGAIYTVDPKRRNCCCPDQQQRCKGTVARCKHVHAAERFLAEVAEAQEQAPQPEPPACCSHCRRPVPPAEAAHCLRVLGEVLCAACYRRRFPAFEEGEARREESRRNVERDFPD